MKHLESGIQKAVAFHLWLRGKPGLVWWHTPNGGKRSPREAAMFKSHGVRPGVADLVLIHDGKAYALELKAPGGRPTEHQLKFLSDFEKAGGYSCCAEGLDRAIAVLESWGVIHRGEQC